MMRKDHQSGQALVLVLLSLSVVLTVVLFGLSRSVNDISTSTKQSDSVRAFSAAEAGIENALLTGAGTSGMVNIGNASYSVEVSSGGSPTFNYPTPLSSGEEMTIWFVSHNSDGSLICDSVSGKPCYSGSNITVCWGSPGTSTSTDQTPAIEVSVYSQSLRDFTNFSNVSIFRGTYDPYSSSTPRTVPNSFSANDSGGCTIGAKQYAFQKNIDMSSLGTNQNGLILAKVKMIYNSATAQPIGFRVPSGTLPPQGLEITSTGTAGGTEAGQTQSTRRVYVYQEWPQFPFSGFSVHFPGGLTTGT